VNKQRWPTFYFRISSFNPMQLARSARYLVWLTDSFINNLDKTSFLILYKGLIRPHFEYVIQARSPYLKRYWIFGESTKTSYKTKVEEIGSMPYSKHLEAHEFTPLENEGHLIKVYKLLTGRELLTTRPHHPSPAGWQLLWYERT